MCFKQLQPERKPWHRMLNISRKRHQKRVKKGYKWEAATGRLGLLTTRLNAGSGICRLEVATPAWVPHTGNPIFLTPKEKVYEEYRNSWISANGLKRWSKDFAKCDFQHQLQTQFLVPSLLWMWSGPTVTRLLCLGSFGVLCKYIPVSARQWAPPCTVKYFLLVSFSYLLL